MEPGTARASGGSPSSCLRNSACDGLCFYKASLSVQQVGDTFLEAKGVTKGELWLNGAALGRVWDVGPQKTLYAPGPMLKQGANEVVVFDLEGKGGASVVGLDKPELGPTQ